MCGKKEHGRPPPGYRVLAIDGNYMNWGLKNLKLELGPPDYVLMDTARRENMRRRDIFINFAMSQGAHPDDAWDMWERFRHEFKLELDLV